MSDRRLPSVERLPSDWGEAFAALPSETPDPDTWRHIASAAWPQRRRPKWPAWLAAAAALAMAAVLPWQLSVEPGPRSQAPLASAPAPMADASTFGTDTAPEETRVAAADRAGPDAATRDRSPDPTPAAGASPTGSADAQPHLASRTEVETELGTDVDAPGPSDATATARGSELERLYAESAQLEALVVMARDDRVATTGPAAALASQYDAHVADIDARLIQPGLSREQRTQLWRERVAAMRELASFESTQRLLASRGERYDAMLVSID